MRPVTGTTRVHAVLGQPVGHSLSPVLHNGWFADAGIDGVYVALPVTDAGFETAVAGLAAAGVAGVNVTLPFKARALALAATATGRARTAGAANVLTFAPGAGPAADNTDGAGFLLDLETRAPGWNQSGGPLVLFGSGGAARGLAQALVEAAAGSVRLVARSPGPARELAADLGLPEEAVFAWDAAADALDGAALVVNATSRGLKDADPFEPDLGPARLDAVIYDTVYAPRHTAFLAAARRQGRTGLDGLGMLAGQAALAFEIWTGVRPDMRAGLLRIEALAP